MLEVAAVTSHKVERLGRAILYALATVLVLAFLSLGSGAP
jgi:hypothetical protein